MEGACSHRRESGFADHPARAECSFAKTLERVLASASDANPKLGYSLDDNVIRIGIAKPQTATTQPALSPQKIAEIRQKLLAEELENDLKELSRQKSMRDGLQAKFGPNNAQVVEAREKVDRLTKRIAELTGRTESSDPFAVDPQMKALLEQKLPEVNFEAIPFADVIDFLRDITKANIFVNWKVLEAAGIDKNAPVTLRLKDVAFAKVLDLVLNSVGGADRNLGYTTDQGVISISLAQDTGDGASGVGETGAVEAAYDSTG